MCCVKTNLNCIISVCTCKIAVLYGKIKINLFEPFFFVLKYNLDAPFVKVKVFQHVNRRSAKDLTLIWLKDTVIIFKFLSNYVPSATVENGLYFKHAGTTKSVFTLARYIDPIEDR